MNYVGRLLSNVKYMYNEINPATLTGAIDVIVVQQEDGSYQCSPFHVRFGKMGVLRSKEKVVDIEVNGEPVDLQMKLGENGEAFFVEQMSSEEFLPANLATSPIPSSVEFMEKGLKKMHSEVNHELLGNMQTTSSKDDAASNVNDLDIDRLVAGIKEPAPMSYVAEKEFGKPIEITVESETGAGGLKKTGSKVLSAIAVHQGDCGSGSSMDDESSIRRNKISPLVDEHEKSTMKDKVRRKRRKSEKERNAASESFQRRNANSESSVSRHSDDEIFKMDDFSDNEETSSFTRVKKMTSSSYIDSDDWSKFLDEPLRSEFHPFSDNDATPIVSPLQTRAPSPKSDTEAELQREVQGEEGDKLEWNWGELPELKSSVGSQFREQISDHEKVKEEEKGEENVSSVNSAEKRGSKWSIMNFMRSTKKIRHSKSLEEGIYLDDLDSEGLDPEIAALYLNAQHIPSNRIRTIQEVKDEDKSSDLGNSLPQSPNSVEGAPSAREFTHMTMESVAMSLCGGLQETEEISHEAFSQALISYDEFTKNPAILENPNLVVRIGGKYYPWTAAGPLLISYLAFQRPLPEVKVESMMKEHMAKGKGGLSSWFSWRRGSEQPLSKKVKVESMMKEHMAKGKGGLSSWFSWRRGSEQPLSKKAESVDETIKQEEKVSEEKPSGKLSTETQLQEEAEEGSEHSSSSEHYKKSIRLTNEQLACLNLKPGPNEITYSVTTRYQGTCLCKSTIYLWQHDSKIVISDIDGTITKSDVMGQILPVLGRDWTHSGVANLYSSIADNGYEILFLSSRAIGQAGYTKGFLKSVIQDSIGLPDGPLLLNPSSLISAFHKEVIVRKPEEFKIGCLKDICSLFPDNPFYAGFGNRINDVWAYRAVGVPCSRIFTINPKGQVSQEMTKTFKSSYNKLQDLSDHVFPPLNSRKSVAFEESSNYSSYTFWRNPVPEIPSDDDLLEPGTEAKK
ncbi:phosphatidate phosphatase LPIN2-like [Anneissia japonica]|uniref:phosphatidate phosphatase LPIN2-like n=1 Tax=Anneissia japonica TaxID=1529436 RepID=UPI001425824B|nr:phosphatidate phosphatase LPIN2-like [Anneissia japonica]